MKFVIVDVDYYDFEAIQDGQYVRQNLLLTRFINKDCL